MDYSYPFSIEWSTEEIIDVVSFFEAIEIAYEKGINRQELLTRYRKFKQVVPSISEEKTYFREFEEESGYVSFRVIKEMKAKTGDETIKLKNK
ncbi:hypothetical protein BBH88_08975 [Planococcus antarcticus DSM 14505]|uniref:Uncharacterized protein n=1 Tax=Planococcus antarcticus DSM 14505 TaxID=1185653 RepID=A0ABM6D4B8_9BACL|nr:UPF0223 family protein [Planococcus antarcticus]ANU10428.1 hypothetical protein BBH88_08975 [Planococcus antarcticus DSM 14505]